MTSIFPKLNNYFNLKDTYRALLVIGSWLQTCIGGNGGETNEQWMKERGSEPGDKLANYRFDLWSGGVWSMSRSIRPKRPCCWSLAGKLWKSAGTKIYVVVGWQMDWANIGYFWACAAKVSNDFTSLEVIDSFLCDCFCCCYISIPSYHEYHPFPWGH